LCFLERKGINMKKSQRFLAVACAFIMAASLNGCVGFSNIPPQYVGKERPNYGHIGVVAARFQPQVKVDVLTSGKGAGAAKGAGKGALGGLYVATGCDWLAPLCAVVTVPVSATVGAIKGASRTESSEKIAESEAAMKIRLDYLKMQEIIADKVIEYAQEVELTGLSILKDQGPEDLNALPVYRPAIGERLDTVVELSVVSLEARVTGVKGEPIPVNMKFRVRLVNTSDGKILDSFIHQFSGCVFSEELLKDNGRMISDVIQYWYREFAEIVVDEIFLNYRPVEQIDVKTDRQLLGDYFLQPLYPEVRLRFDKVDCQEPTFRWEALPRLKELREASAGSRITDLKYDLRIFEPDNMSENNYQITGLTEPKFKLSGFFKPCHNYIWTVRARFLLDGKRQATEWSGTYYYWRAQPWWWRRDSYPPRVMHVSNSFYYLPFRIPAASPEEKCPYLPYRLRALPTEKCPWSPR